MKVRIPLMVVLIGFIAISVACDDPVANVTATPHSSYRNYTEAEIVGIFHNAVVRECDPLGWLVIFKEGYRASHYKGITPGSEGWVVFWEHPSPPPFIDINMGSFWPYDGELQKKWPQEFPYC